MILLQYLILFFKGFIIGLGKVIPGVSGAILAISLGLYDECLKIIAKFPKINLKELIYLSAIALGVIFSIMKFSNVIMYYLKIYPVYTMIFFLALIIGTVPNTLKNTNNFNLKKAIFISIFLAFIFSIITLNKEASFEVTSIYSYFVVFLLGAIEAFSSILPGISGTAIFISIGCYEFILRFFANPFADIYVLLAFLLGFIISFYLCAKVINYLFKNKKDLMWKIIIVLLLTSIITMFKEIPIVISVKNIIISIFWFVIGLVVSLTIPCEK